MVHRGKEYVETCSSENGNESIGCEDISPSVFPVDVINESLYQGQDLLKSGSRDFGYTTEEDANDCDVATTASHLKLSKQRRGRWSGVSELSFPPVPLEMPKPRHHIDDQDEDWFSSDIGSDF